VCARVCLCVRERERKRTQKHWLLEETITCHVHIICENMFFENMFFENMLCVYRIVEEMWYHVPCHVHMVHEHLWYARERERERESARARVRKRGRQRESERENMFYVMYTWSVRACSVRTYSLMKCHVVCIENCKICVKMRHGMYAWFVRTCSVGKFHVCTKY